LSVDNQLKAIMQADQLLTGLN